MSVGQRKDPSGKYMQMCLTFANLLFVKGGEWNKSNYDLYCEELITFDEMLHIGLGCTLQDLRELKNYDEALISAGWKRTKALSFDGKAHLTTPLNSTDYISYVLAEIDKRKSGKREEIRKRQAESIKRCTHKRRGITKSVDDGTITKAALEELKIKQDYKCYHCGCELDFDSKNMVHLDHFYPISKKGTNSIYNVVWSCKTCNVRKGSKVPDTLLLI